MKILLYAPLYPSTCPQIARTVSQILHIYEEVDAQGQYRVCWPQLRQLSAVGQLLILVCDKGEFHPREAKRLWDMLLGFLDRDKHAIEMAAALRQAARALGVEPNGVQEFSAMEANGMLNQPDSHFPFDFDPLSWFTIGEQNGL